MAIIAHIATAAGGASPWIIPVATAHVGHLCLGVDFTGGVASVGGLGLSWWQETQITISAAPNRVLQHWVGYGTVIPGDISIKVVGGAAMVNATTLFSVSGLLPGTLAVVNDSEALDLSAPLSMTLAEVPFAAPDNITVGIFWTGTGVISAGAGFTLLGAAAQIASEYKLSADTTIDMSWTVAGGAAGLGAELAVYHDPNTTFALRHIGKTTFILTEPT